MNDLKIIKAAFEKMRGFDIVQRHKFIDDALHDLIGDITTEIKKEQYNSAILGEDYRTTYDLKQKQEI